MKINKLGTLRTLELISKDIFDPIGNMLRLSMVFIRNPFKVTVIFFHVVVYIKMSEPSQHTPKKKLKLMPSLINCIAS